MSLKLPSTLQFIGDVGASGHGRVIYYSGGMLSGSWLFRFVGVT